MKYVRHLLCIALLLLISSTAFANDKGGAEKEVGDVDFAGILMGHIKDSYDWHITDVGDTPLIIHLPIIVKSSTGWHVFSSSEFEHHAIAEGDMKGYRKGPHDLYIASTGINEVKIVEIQGGEEVRPLDISLTKTALVAIIDGIILLIIVLIPARWCRRHKIDDEAPKGFTGLMSMFIMYIYDDVIKTTLGEKADKFAPYLLTCFFFIFTANIMGIVPFPPGGGNLTGNIACTFFFALMTFLVTNIFGTKTYWKDIFWPDVPTWLKAPVPLMPIIELFGIFTKPLALMVRLFANMFAGHAIALSFALLIFIMFGVNMWAGSGMTVVSVLLSVFMMLLEVLVCFIQALVFTMLSAVFISLSQVKEEKE